LLKAQKDESIKDTLSYEIKQIILKGDKPNNILELKVPIVFSSQEVIQIAKIFEERYNLINSYMEST